MRLRAEEFEFFTPAQDVRVYTLSQGEREFKHIDPDVTRRNLWSMARTGRQLPDGSNLKLRVCKTTTGLDTTEQEFIDFRMKLAEAWEKYAKNKRAHL